MGLSLITNRTQADVDALKALLKKGVAGMSAAELAAFNAGGHKGGYDYTDYNRVCAAVQELVTLFGQYGVSVYTTARSDWTETEIINATARTALLTDLDALKSAMYGTIEMPASLDYMTFQVANDIEELLLELEWNIYCLIAGIFYSGEIYCGEV